MGAHICIQQWRVLQGTSRGSVFQMINPLGLHCVAAHLHYRINLQDPRRQHAVGVSARPTQGGVPLKLDSYIALWSGVSVASVLPFPAVPPAVSTQFSRKWILLDHLQTTISFFTHQTAYASTSLWQGCRWHASFLVILHQVWVRAGQVQAQQCCRVSGPQLRTGSGVHLPWTLCDCPLVPSTTLLCSSTGIGSRHCPRPNVSNTAQQISLAMQM